MQGENKTKDQLVNELAAMRQRVTELERINQDMDASTYTIVHDLKRQLSIILGFSNLLEEDYTTISRTELLERLKVVVKSGHKMNNLIDELMLLVHVRGVESPEIVQLDMDSIVTEALNRLTHVIRKKQAEIVVPDRWPKTVGYEPWVEEVWFTYISEVLRYDDHPLRVVIGAVEQADEMARFWVGIDDRDLTPEQRMRVSQIYDNFRPGLVQSIMDKLNGEFGVAKEESQNSGVYFTLPSGK
jgi:light-regulated signal transduction histidine kinase (bacteriophytochrome)